MSKQSDSRRRWRSLWQTLVGTAIVVVLVIMPVGFVYYGSFGAMWTAAAGYRLYLEHDEFDLGALDAGSTSRVDVPVRNVTAETLRILGGRSSCGCTVISELPMDIPPRESRILPVLVRAPQTGILAATILLVTDRIDEQFRIVVRGKVKERSAARPAVSTAK